MFVTVALKKRELLANLTPAIGASGPHGFAVRERLRSSFANLASTASHRAFRDVRNAPLVGRDARNTQLSWVKNKAEYFSRGGWTGFAAREVICPTGCFVAATAIDLPLRVATHNPPRWRGQASFNRNKSARRGLSPTPPKIGRFR
ncbi:hypothetical protein [Bradyrhizobium sp. S69]|uniref:hypothetical protein n=1 Tax=Bradyrhizobium sp. S69 TaxID=1641856 RepID=UPI001AEE5FA4|nr:hypothetical protein [Bradyrhizobium sp. S69]